MRPLLHPTLVNGQFGDPALYVETLFEKRAIMFDLGDISDLSPRKIQRLEHIFVSHAGRAGEGDPALRAERFHRSRSSQASCLSLEPHRSFYVRLGLYRNGNRSGLGTHTVQLRLKHAFAIEAADEGHLIDGVLYSESTFQVTTSVLEHRTPCLGFAIEEPTHVNVWKSRLGELGLPVGPWLRELKRAVIENRRDDYSIRVGRSKTSNERAILLRELGSAVTVTPGQKIGYVTDVADTPANRQAIIQLARNADLLFIEAAFAQADAAPAAERAHLTTVAAGSIAREAAVRRIEPFHFSPRCSGREARLLNEVMAAFTGRQPQQVGS